jgi:Na+-transporting methylmalonyl-CoA/oxaloacetate decarboxylase gamma subunit
MSTLLALLTLAIGSLISKFVEKRRSPPHKAPRSHKAA